MRGRRGRWSKIFDRWSNLAAQVSYGAWFAYLGNGYAWDYFLVAACRSNTGQNTIQNNGKYWSNNGQMAKRLRVGLLPRRCLQVKHSSKYWSNTGQMSGQSRC
jgi:hypothetical protein